MARSADTPSAARRPGGLAASPRARRALRERGIDPRQVHGTGPEGRIVEADVLRAEHEAAASAPRPAQGISPMRRAVAAKVTESFTTVPHFYLRAEADVSAVFEARRQFVDQVERDYGVRVSLTDLLLRALALALGDCPGANRVWRQDGIVELPTVDVGLVVQVGDGLLVPVIHGADRLGLVDLARRRQELVAAARSGRLPADALHGGATALSNLGNHRVDEFAAVISPPHSSMLAVGRAAERPAVFDGRLCARRTLHLTLSVDHRVMDGEPAAEFLDRVVDQLERPCVRLCEAPP